MRIYEIDPGEKENIYDNSGGLERYATVIKRDCSESLSAMQLTGKVLYRGFRSAPSAAFKGASRDNRTPYSRRQFVKEFNSELAEIGIETNRTNSISTSSKSTDASIFGQLYYLFPIDGFKFMWSPRIDDFGDHFMDYDYLSLAKSSFGIPRNENFAAVLEYTDKDFAKALDSEHEISIHGQYYAIEVEQPVFGKEQGISLPQYLGIKK
jgi:hypothetical protein